MVGLIRILDCFMAESFVVLVFGLGLERHCVLWVSSKGWFYSSNGSSLYFVATMRSSVSL